VDVGFRVKVKSEQDFQDIKDVSREVLGYCGG
jgi:hypothetical protein